MGWGSLGELFISLGFDVDGDKLKNFRSQLRDTHEEMVKLGTVTAGTLTTLGVFTQRYADGAVRLTNMASLWGANAQAAQTFANALHQVNSQISITAGQDKYRGFAEMINAKVPVGGGAYGALSLLGVTNPWGSPDEVMQEIRKNLPSHMGSLGSSPEKQRARANDLLGQVGLGDSLNAVLMPDSQYSAASQYNTTGGTLESLSKFARATAELDEAMNKFSNDIAGELGEKLLKVVQFLTKAVNLIDAFNTSHPGAGTVEGVAGATVASLGGWAVLRRLFGSKAAAQGGGTAFEEFAASWNGAAAGGGAAEAAGGIGALGSAGILALFGSIPWVAGWGGDKIGNYLKGSGKTSFTDAQRVGIRRALMDESGPGLDPNAVGDNGQALGIAQWHPDRQANFARWAGHSMRGSSRDEQLAFVNYELTQGMERAAGDKISRTSGEQDAYLATKKYYERNAGSQNIVVNVHSNATDNQVVAKLVTDHFQRTINNAYAQTNLGPQ